ncbi:hypothetical protein GWI33_006237, partial [Rhynchophorus ferrugineus]
ALLSDKDKRGATIKQDPSPDNGEKTAESRRRHLWNRGGSSNRYYSESRPGPPYPSGYGSGEGYDNYGYIASGPSSFGHSDNYDDRYESHIDKYRPNVYGPSYGYPYESPTGYIEPHYVQELGERESGLHKVFALKKILIPLAGLAILGAAAITSSNPVLLQLGVVNGRRRKRSLPGVYPTNYLLKPIEKRL